MRTVLYCHACLYFTLLKHTPGFTHTHENENIHPPTPTHPFFKPPTTHPRHRHPAPSPPAVPPPGPLGVHRRLPRNPDGPQHGLAGPHAQPPDSGPVRPPRPPGARRELVWDAAVGRWVGACGRWVWSGLLASFVCGGGLSVCQCVCRFLMLGLLGCPCPSSHAACVGAT